MASTRSVPTEAPVVFAPDWGRDNWRLWKLVASANVDELPDTVEEMLREATAQPDGNGIKAAFSLSLLSDILKAGGQAWVRDSRLFVAWPDWNGSEGRRQARDAMSAAREMRNLTPDEVLRVKPLFAPEIDGEEFAAVLREAEFVLQSATSEHPSGVSYQEAFAAALRHWSMPYRGRSGRMKRFVLTARHPLLGAHPVVAAILELGDEAPFCSWRDDLLGLSGKAFLAWIERKPREARKEVADRMRAMRACLRPTSMGLSLSSATARDVVAQRAAIEQAAHGRSLVLDQQHDLLKDRKRLAYGLRLARGEYALARSVSTTPLPADDQDLMAGVRAVHDLLLPRTHLEATVCGAVPPFSAALGGKLVVAFLSHPDVVSSTIGGESELLGWSFDHERLRSLLPSHGMLCVTTKGLYANHAAIYTRSELPGLAAPLRMKHLANTVGITTTLVSDRTTRYARMLLETQAGDRTRVSSVYGSGGAKRHRAIHAATLAVGLPPRIAFAGIRRPVYGVKFVTNPESVCWLNEVPEWLICREEDPTGFCQRAVSLWRRRWLDRAIARIHDYALVPSLPRMLETGAGVDAPEAETVE